MADEAHPLVTIGITSYKNGKYIHEILKIVRLHMYDNWELVVVDDCSTDDSVQIIEKWVSEFPAVNVRFIRHAVNRGVCAVYNLILNEAWGKYMSIVGFNDGFLPEKTSRCIVAVK